MAIFIDKRRSVRCDRCHKHITPEESKFGEGKCKGCLKQITNNKKTWQRIKKLRRKRHGKDD
jgi:Zn finger protein HypA/HybF involved in hydrogenase expression